MKGQVSIIPLVPTLNGRRGPDDITGLVTPVVVNAVEAVLPSRAGAHIREECLEVEPARRHGDPAPAVEREIVVRRIAASLNHAAPNHVLGGLRPSVRGAASPDVAVVAAAGPRIAGSQRVLVRRRRSAARAATDPVLRRRSATYDGQPSENIPRCDWYSDLRRVQTAPLSTPATTRQRSTAPDVVGAGRAFVPARTATVPVAATVRRGAENRQATECDADGREQFHELDFSAMLTQEAATCPS